ncbi:Hypothetical predicted protein [Podarcis lilfordi]|uniref:Uncharacterized protein n=1 Tax=Podarcis lilfordi TaxID=74358 RepID=A0AA35KXY0_9SAUR|nr:Hypothetical predicted protein [Podarcis lilfordi]
MELLASQPCGLNLATSLPHIGFEDISGYTRQNILLSGHVKPLDENRLARSRRK